jgi:hypothetical protein
MAARPVRRGSRIKAFGKESRWSKGKNGQKRNYIRRNVA